MEIYTDTQRDADFDARFGKGVSQKLRDIGNIDFKTKTRLRDFLGNESFAIEWNRKKMSDERIGQFQRVCEMLVRDTADSIVDILGEPESMEEEFGTNENRAFLLERLGLLRAEEGEIGKAA